MTLSSLTWLIVLAIAVQVAVWMAMAVSRHWREYASLGNRPAEAGAPAATAVNPGAAGWEGFRPFRVEQKVYEDEARSTCSFYLVPVDGAPLPAFEPGQYLTLREDVTGPGAKEPSLATRCYSLSDRPHPDRYRVTVKRVAAPADRPDLPPGLFSNHLHDTVQEGDVLSVKAPAGPFHLADRSTSPVALVGGGIGITPMLSIVETLLHEGSEREIWLFYGVRNRSEQVMKRRLETLAEAHPNLRLHICYSRPGEGDIAGVDYQHQGRVDVDLLRLTLPRQVETFYVCGPPALMESLVPGLEAWGIPPDRIHYEAFGPSSVKRRSPPAAAASSKPLTVTFAKTGKRLPWDPAAGSLLDFAEANAIPVTSGCRSGACGGCQTAIESGEVDYFQPPQADVEPGNCLLCIATPKDDLKLSA